MTKKLIVLASLCVTSFQAGTPRCSGETPANTLSDAQRRGGWRLLFDGMTANGWRNYRQEGLGQGWAVRDGALVRAANGAGDIVTRDQFKYFELSLEYRIAQGGNSGVMFHVTETAAQPWHSGPEVQIQDNVAGRDPQKSGWLYQLYEPVKPEWAIRFERQVPQGRRRVGSAGGRQQVRQLSGVWESAAGTPLPARPW
jgi:hypothetical protein